jgi:hypothetical protein
VGGHGATFTLKALIAVVLLAALGAALAMPSIEAARRAEAERAASAAMRALNGAQTDFRSNDRDGDRIANYWVHDVYSLHAMVPSPDGQTPGDVSRPERMIRLIEPSIAAADATGALILPGVVSPERAIGAFRPRQSYVFRMFREYERHPGPGVEAYGGPKHATKFGLVALPVSYRRGRKLFLTHQGIGVRLADPGDAYEAEYHATARGASIRWRGAVIGGEPFTPATPMPRALGAAGWAFFD